MMFGFWILDVEAETLDDTSVLPRRQPRVVPWLHTCNDHLSQRGISAVILGLCVSP